MNLTIKAGAKASGEAMHSTVHLPRFPGTQRDIALSTVHFVHQNVAKALWSIDKIENVFARRTVSEILLDGSTFAYAPCSERTLVAATVLSHNGVQPTVIYHERRIPGFGPSSPHFAVEFEAEGEPHMMDFGARETRLMPGGYWYDAKWQETITLQRDLAVDLAANVDTVETLYARYLTAQLDIPSKLAWYEAQLSQRHSRVVEERIALSPEASLYRRVD